MSGSVLYTHDIPEIGQTVQVADGILWARFALPFALNHINLYLLESPTGWTVVDTGLGDPTTQTAWLRIFAEDLGGKPVEQVYVTHFHPDHMGQAGWMTSRWGLPLITSRTEWLIARMLASDDTDGSRAQAAGAFYQRAGVPNDLATTLQKRVSGYKRGVTPIPSAFSRVQHGDVLKVDGTDWIVTVGRGHAPEHVGLFSPERKIFLAGDSILPRISPNISVWPAEPMADPLQEFYTTLEDFKAMPEDTFVLPAHDAPFTGLHGRLDDLAEHHTERLSILIDAMRAKPITAWDAVDVLFRPGMDPQQMSFALGEAIAHLNRLVISGAVQIEKTADMRGLYHCP